MPIITINGKPFEFVKGQKILEVAIEHREEIPHYCYHPGLSIPANCRICLAEVSQVNHRSGKLELIPKLLPTCQTDAVDGMEVTTHSAKAQENQKAVMEYLLINHPVDCPVCDQAGECHLQDYSYEYGRGESRFVEEKIKNPKKDVGPHVLLYSDRCIMCTRCVRFTREVTGTGELMVEGRGGTESIDVFPGLALDNELSGNVVDICPVGALLDKDFLFQQRVWLLKSAASIDGITGSGDNITVEHNEGRVYRVKPRTNLEVNKWWISDEVRYGWKFVHDETRLTLPATKSQPAAKPEQAHEAWKSALSSADSLLSGAVRSGSRVALCVSPMLSCEDAFLLAHMVLAYDKEALLGVGPVPRSGADKTFPGGFTLCAEKAPNARGVRRVLDAVAAAARRTTGGGSAGSSVVDWQAFTTAVSSMKRAVCVMTGNYGAPWVAPGSLAAFSECKLIMLDTLPNRLTTTADVLLPAATWLEKSGSFESASGRLQGFDAAIDCIESVRSEAQIAIDLDALRRGAWPNSFTLKTIRAEMATTLGLEAFGTEIGPTAVRKSVPSDMVYIQL
ncbi:MAG: NADH:ubiquinone oxidoreductase [Phycisphaerales bacterium]|nr:NADH:ubiquinone oxidoreductase [Phycisphaerales bacterium]